MEKVSCRKAFTATLLEKALNDDSIFAVTTDSRGSVTIGEFAKKLPDRFIELGIAEQNAVSCASGIAKTGKNVFVAGPASFLAARAYEQVKVDVAYNNSNVKIVGVSAGVSYGPLGCTHTTMHDFASMRALPNISILAPSDAVQTAFLTEKLCKLHGPYYMRMGRGDVDRVYQPGESFEIGKAKLVREGNDATIIACGEMVAPAVAASDLLRQQGINVRVLDCFTIKPLDIEAVKSALTDTKLVITAEEHSTLGGLGEAVAHVAVALRHSAHVEIMGLPEEVIIGKPHELFQHYGLTAENLAGKVLSLLEGLQ